MKINQTEILIAILVIFFLLGVGGLIREDMKNNQILELKKLELMKK